MRCVRLGRDQGGWAAKRVAPSPPDPASCARTIRREGFDTRKLRAKMVRRLLVLWRLPDLAQMRSARCPLFGRYEGKSGPRGLRVFVDAEVIRGGPLLEVARHGREAWRAAPRYRAVAEQHFLHAHIRGRCYCVRNLYATIRATMLAKISSAGRDFRIIGLVEWRAADRPC